MKSTHYLRILPLLVLAAACQPEQPEEEDLDTPEATTGAAAAVAEQPASAAPTAAERTAVAEIAATEGNETNGTVRFAAEGETVRIEGTIEGLEPGAHGLHIHAKGDCSAPDASSAGDHFSPNEDPHGSPRDLPGEHHVGDLGNIVADDDGTADVMAEDDEIRLDGPDSVVGKAVVVHSGRDDMETQPSGDSGERVGCGVIRLAQATGGSAEAAGETTAMSTGMHDAESDTGSVD